VCFRINPGGLRELMFVAGTCRLVPPAFAAWRIRFGPRPQLTKAPLGKLSLLCAEQALLCVFDFVHPARDMSCAFSLHDVL